MGKFIVFLSALVVLTAFSFKTTHNPRHTIRVSLIDTGIDLDDNTLTKYLCDAPSHYDFTGKGIQDVIGHGTMVAHLIVDNARDADFCLVIYKYYDDKASNEENITRVIEAFTKSIDQGDDLINYSGGGPDSEEVEKEVLARFKGIVVVAAGNEGKELGKDGYNYFPAGYALDKDGVGLKNVVPVGSVDEDGKRSKFSNYGEQVKFWESGVYGEVSGTSFSTARITGKLVYSMHRLGVTPNEYAMPRR